MFLSAICPKKRVPSTVTPALLMILERELAWSSTRKIKKIVFGCYRHLIDKFSRWLIGPSSARVVRSEFKLENKKCAGGRGGHRSAHDDEEKRIFHLKKIYLRGLLRRTSNKFSSLQGILLSS